MVCFLATLKILIFIRNFPNLFLISFKKTVCFSFRVKILQESKQNLDPPGTTHLCTYIKDFFCHCHLVNAVLGKNRNGSSGKCKLPRLEILRYSSTAYSLHSALCTLHSALYTLHSALYTLYSILYTLHSTLYSTDSTLSSLVKVFRLHKEGRSIWCRYKKTGTRRQVCLLVTKTSLEIFPASLAHPSNSRVEKGKIRRKKKTKNVGRQRFTYRRLRSRSLGWSEMSPSNFLQ